MPGVSYEQADEEQLEVLAEALEYHQHLLDDAVALRHGEASQEVKQARRFAADETGRRYFEGEREREHTKPRDVRRSRSRVERLQRVYQLRVSPRKYD